MSFCMAGCFSEYACNALFSLSRSFRRSRGTLTPLRSDRASRRLIRARDALSLSSLIRLSLLYPSTFRERFWSFIASTSLVEYCLLYTSDAADEEDSVDLGGRRIIKKK